MPELLKLSDLSLNNAVLLILLDDLGSNSLGSLTENVDDLLCLAGLENDIALECAAGVGIVVELTVRSWAEGISLSALWISLPLRLRSLRRTVF